MFLKICVFYALLAVMGVATQQFDNEVKPDLIKDFSDIMNLIPKTVLDELIAKHIFIDPKCRKALNFLRSKEFKQVLQQAVNLEEIADILVFLHALKDSNNYTNKRLQSNDVFQDYNLEYIIVNAPRSMHRVDMGLIAIDADENAESGTTAVKTHNLHDFNAFINELLEHFPRDQFVQMVKDKRAKSVNFDTFYKAARSTDLPAKVEAALQTPNVLKLQQQFNAHNIDLKSLVPIAFKVLSWGPPAVNRPKMLKYTLFF